MAIKNHAEKPTWEIPTKKLTQEVATRTGKNETVMKKTLGQ